MHEVKKILRQVLNIRSEEQDTSSQSLLLLDISGTHCCAGIMNTGTGELAELVYYVSEGHFEIQVSDIFEKHPEFNKQFFSVAVSYSFSENILFPFTIYEPRDAAFHLDAIYGPGEATELVTELITEKDVYNVYRLSRRLQETLNRRYPAGRFFHKYSVFLKDPASAQGDRLVVDFGTDQISVVAFKLGELQLAQAFQYASPEDVLYFLLKICREFNLSQQEVKVELSGLIEKDSSIYRELYKYFLHLDFAPIQPGMKLSPAFDEFPPHYFSFISKLARCVS